MILKYPVSHLAKELGDTYRIKPSESTALNSDSTYPSAATGKRNDRFKQIAREDKLIENIETLKDYLSEAMKKGILFRA